MNKKSITLLKLAKGELDAIKYMIEEGWDCIDVSNRILETQYLLNKANNLIYLNKLGSEEFEPI